MTLFKKSVKVTFDDRQMHKKAKEKWKFKLYNDHYTHKTYSWTLFTLTVKKLSLSAEIVTILASRELIRSWRSRVSWWCWSLLWLNSACNCSASAVVFFSSRRIWSYFSCFSFKAYVKQMYRKVKLEIFLALSSANIESHSIYQTIFHTLLVAVIHSFALLTTFTLHKENLLFKFKRGK